MAGVILPTVRALDQGPATVVKLPHACVLPKVPIKLVKQLRPVNAIGKALAIDQFIIFLSKYKKRYRKSKGFCFDSPFLWGWPGTCAAPDPCDPAQARDTNSLRGCQP